MICACRMDAGGVEQGVLREAFRRVESDEKKKCGRKREVAAGDGGAKALGRLGLRKVRTGRGVQRRSNSAAQRAKTRVSLLPGTFARRLRERKLCSSSQASAAVVARESTGRRLVVVLSAAMMVRQRVCSWWRFSRSSVAWPSSRRRRQRLANQASQASMDWRLPVGEAAGSPAICPHGEVEGAAEGAGGALIGSEDGRAAVECLLNL